MWTLILGIANLILSLPLAVHEHEEGALFCFAWGVYFTFAGLRGFRRSHRDNQQYALALQHAEAATELLQHGNAPDEIAAEFDRRYKIAPAITLEFLASDRLRVIGRDFKSDSTGMWLSWLSSGRREPIPPPLQSIEKLNRRRDLFNLSDGVRFYALEGWRSIPAHGWLVALRDYLLFLPYEEWESVGHGTVKEFIMNFFPSSVGLSSLAREIAEGFQTEMKLEVSEKLVEEFLKRSDLRNSFAVPWRDVVRVWKEPVTGWGPPRTYLMVAHGNETQPTIRKLSLGRGYREAWVDNWIETARIICALEGVLIVV